MLNYTEVSTDPVLEVGRTSVGPKKRQCRVVFFVGWLLHVVLYLFDVGFCHAEA